eukprot:s6024_g1.t1
MKMVLANLGYHPVWMQSVNILVTTEKQAVAQSMKGAARCLHLFCFSAAARPMVGVSTSSLFTFFSTFFICKAEEEAMKLLARFRNDRVEMALALCDVGRLKIEVLARLAEDLQEHMQEQVPPALKFCVTEAMRTILKSAWQVVQGLAPAHPDAELRTCKEAHRILAVLLGIRSLITLPILEQNCESECSDLKDSVLERIERNLKDHARFPALGMRATSTDLGRFKDHNQLVGNAAIASALSPSVTVREHSEGGNDDWLDRLEHGCDPEVGEWQQVPSVGSWSLGSSSSNWTWDLVDQPVDHM